MGVLQFDGIDDGLQWTTVTTALADVADGAWTCGALLKWEDLTHFNGVSYLLSGGAPGVAEAGMSFSSSSNRIHIDVSTGVPFTSSEAFSTGQTYMIVMSKGAGSATPRVAIKDGPAGSWAHTNGDATLADQIDATQVEIGMWEEGDFFEGYIGLIGWWEGAMSDGNKEALATNWRTSDWWASSHGQPAFLAELNVAAASVVDLASNASSLSVVGAPTLDSGETLDSWSFDGIGGEPDPAGEAGPRLIVTQANRQVW